MPDQANHVEVQGRIHWVRGKRVMLDADLAKFYGVATRELNRAVSRNQDRFPEDFAFPLSLAETRALMSQIGTSKPGRGGVRKPARVFTEQGVAMLAGVLRSPRAIAMSIAIIRAFMRLRELARHAPGTGRQTRRTGAQARAARRRDRTPLRSHSSHARSANR